DTERAKGGQPYQSTGSSLVPVEDLPLHCLRSAFPRRNPRLRRSWLNYRRTNSKPSSRARAVQDWDTLYDAVEQQIKDQRNLVEWWSTNVSVREKNRKLRVDRATVPLDADLRSVPLEAAEGLTRGKSP